MKKTILMLLIILLAISVKIIFKSTYAYHYELEETTLFYKTDKNELEENIKIYLMNIDDILIPNSSYNYSEKLIYNYDFLVHFALDYILKYEESYYQEIKILEEFNYINKNGIAKQTNKYIPLKEIYRITDKYFGIKDFEIINDDINIIDNNISLIDYEENYFPLEIKEVSINDNYPIIEATVEYENNNNYLYFFEVKNNVLKLNNIEVLS